MRHLINSFINDDAGFVVSAELVLVSSIAVLSMVVGLSQVANSINNELNDVADSFGALNQTFCVQGYQGCKAHTTGSTYSDNTDNCDYTSIGSSAPQGEGGWSN